MSGSPEVERIETEQTVKLIPEHMKESLALVNGLVVGCFKVKR